MKKNAYNTAKRLNKPRFHNANSIKNIKKASKEYKNAVRLEKLKEINGRNKRFRSKNIKDRRYFWSMLSSKNNKPKVLPSLNSFYDSFKSLASD